MHWSGYLLVRETDLMHSTSTRAMMVTSGTKRTCGACPQRGLTRRAVVDCTYFISRALAYVAAQERSHPESMCVPKAGTSFGGPHFMSRICAIGPSGCL